MSTTVSNTQIWEKMVDIGMDLATLKAMTRSLTEDVQELKPMPGLLAGHEMRLQRLEEHRPDIFDDQEIRDIRRILDDWRMRIERKRIVFLAIASALALVVLTAAMTVISQHGLL
ncbi:MAG: hypothetical protein ACRDFS_10670 [Chloroflexota bacterium]